MGAQTFAPTLLAIAACTRPSRGTHPPQAAPTRTCQCRTAVGPVPLRQSCQVLLAPCLVTLDPSAENDVPERGAEYDLVGVRRSPPSLDIEVVLRNIRHDPRCMRRAPLS